MPQPSQGQDLLEGVYRTPLELLRPVDKRWKIGFDLAADNKNAAPLRLGKVMHVHSKPWFTEADNALVQPWPTVKDADWWNWLNPPYGKEDGGLGAWTEKAEIEAKRGARTVMLIPSATGASWLEPCRRSAQIIFLIGRPVFEFINPMTHKNPAKRGQPNTDPYGKDMLLAVFGQGTGVSWWNWRK
jgi:hypothetical protein